MLTPLVVLTAIVGTIAALLIANNALSISLTSPLILGGVIIYFTAVTALGWLGLRYVRRLQSLGMTDSLSGLPNRRSLHADVKRHSVEGSELAIALIDLDGFKLVNDQYGHSVGDDVIKHAADVLSELCGDDARCYRLGGDEFAISMSGPVVGTIVEGISRGLIDYLKKPVNIEHRRIVIGASVGLSSSKGADQPSSSELLRRSDVAMYASKRAGKMRCTWYSPEFDRNREAWQQLDDDMREALVQRGILSALSTLGRCRDGAGS